MDKDQQEHVLNGSRFGLLVFARSRARGPGVVRYTVGIASRVLNCPRQQGNFTHGLANGLDSVSDAAAEKALRIAITERINQEDIPRLLRMLHWTET